MLTKLIDGYITIKVKKSFLEEKYFGNKLSIDAHIAIETKNNIVYLSGIVDDEYMEKNAIDLAKQIRGVDDVVCNLKFWKKFPVANDYLFMSLF
jgi:osmotically-inducible protein OsmY